MMVIAIGDSIAAGIGDAPTNGRLTAWAGRLADWCSGSSMNLAIPGARIGLVASLQAPAAVLAQPDLVLFSVGGNDVVDRRFHPDRFEDGLRSTMETIGAARPRMVLLTVSDWPAAWPMPSRLRETLRRRIRRVNDLIRRHAIEHHAFLIERGVTDPLQDRTCLHADRVHLSPLGYHLLARHTAELLGLVHGPEHPIDRVPHFQAPLRAQHLRPLIRRTPDLAGLLVSRKG